MRYIIALVALLLAAPVVHADPKTPRGIVFAYECKQIDPQITGFSCEFDNGQLTIVHHERLKDMTPERRDRANYELEKIALRYFELGGKGFDVRADFWPLTRRRLCSHVKNSPYYDYGCSDYTAKN